MGKIYQLYQQRLELLSLAMQAFPDKVASPSSPSAVGLVRPSRQFVKDAKMNQEGRRGPSFVVTGKEKWHGPRGRVRATPLAFHRPMHDASYLRPYEYEVIVVPYPSLSATPALSLRGRETTHPCTMRP
jgi:hypothetical protein